MLWNSNKQKGKKGEIGKLKSKTTAQQIIESYIETHQY